MQSLESVNRRAWRRRRTKSRNRFRPVGQRCQCAGGPLNGVAPAMYCETARYRAEYRQNRHMSGADTPVLSLRLIDPFHGTTTIEVDSYVRHRTDEASS